ncbi:MFS transporter [Herbidospora sp. NBRC 101105]|uniref:MDR family MFS transporter n=1 Tax=Herbidospora sp. NBRC 101105 TaxID=3032195 RepID=UPI0024A0E349|nr:MFS transporter [Herbidospora sp. NBRC 101105]GLX93600.1 putative ABC transport system membrane protein [Herbidospora sp. NBRC 101105]
MTAWRSFDATTRLLMVNQFTINVAFYLLMPFLAGHLSGGLGLAGWTVGLVLGVRNLSQQGLFLLGGTLADRLGYRPVIIAGCLLRTLGFALLGFAHTLPVLLAASAMTGFAGALFNPAVRAYLAHTAGDRRVEAFALFNVFYQAGILLGPVVGLALMAADFRLVCATAAGVFALLTAVQVLALPPGPETRTGPAGVLADWRAVLANRPFVLFAGVMTGSYVLSFQVYLALPLALGDPGAVTLLFVVSGGIAVLGQLRITAWARARWTPAQAMTWGLTLMGAAFVPLTLTTWPGAVLLCAALLGVGTALTYPFEMDTVVALSGGRLVATHYGLYNSIAGIGITVGNLAVGALLDRAALLWVALACLGGGCAAGVHLLGRSGLTRPLPWAHG